MILLIVNEFQRLPAMGSNQQDTNNGWMYRLSPSNSDCGIHQHCVPQEGAAIDGKKSGTRVDIVIL